MPPQVRPVLIQHEVEKTLAALGVEYELEIYKSLLGHEGRGVEPLVESLGEIHQHLFASKLRFEAPDRASIWTDTNVYNELGIPAVKIGPRGKRIGPRAEEIQIDDMVNAAQIYALIALDICSRERPGV
jgi:acetylornithine deacetylase/succinyl-diaminopimelate desuccinylase-like protein